MSESSGSDADTAPGARVGTLLAERYRLERHIGSGASAQVFAALDELLQLPVAIKLLHDSLDAERQIREATLAMSLNHSAIVRCDGAFTEGDQLFIVMELAEGESLAERLLRGPLNLGEIVLVLRSVAEALKHAHERGVLHRDIAPGNILLAKAEGRVVGARVIDFGVAKLISSTSGNTQTVGVGTAAYAAPEQLAGRPTPQSDLYGLGAVLFLMLTGNPPSIGGGGSIGRHLPRSTPSWLADLVRALLTPDPKRRIQSAADLLARMPSTEKRTLSIGSRRLLILLCVIVVGPLLTAITMVQFSMDARHRAGQLCAWLEEKQLITWTNPRVLGTMAMSASSIGDIETLNRLFKGGRMPSERTQWLLADCLEAAVQNGQLAAAAQLLDLGAKIPSDDRGLSLNLISQVFISRSPMMLQLLVKRGMDMRPVFERANSFTAAAVNRDPAMFAMLLSLLSSYTELPPVGDPPLFVAINSNDPERYIALVVAAGPRVINAKDGTGAHALIRALHSVSLPQVEKLLKVPGLDLEQPGKDGSTALLFAAGVAAEDSAAVRAVRLAACKLLIEHGANVNARNAVGNRALSIAAELQLVELVRLLLDHPDIQVNASDERGDTALHRAFVAGETSPEVLRLLLAHGADLSLKNAAGLTPHELAQRMGREQILDRVLRE